MRKKKKKGNQEKKKHNQTNQKTSLDLTPLWRSGS